MSLYFFSLYVMIQCFLYIFLHVQSSSSSNTTSVTTHPGNAIVGKPFGIQPTLQGALLIANNLSINVTSNCSLHESHTFELTADRYTAKYRDLRIEQPGRCILMFTLITEDNSSQVASNAFEVLSRELYIEIEIDDIIHISKNTSNHSNLRFKFAIYPQGFSTEWFYKVSLNSTVPHLISQSCSGHINTTPVELTHCINVNWGYRQRITIFLNSTQLQWVLSNTSAPFDVFLEKSSTGLSQHLVILHLEGDMPDGDARDENLCGLGWNVKGNVTKFIDICSHIGTILSVGNKQWIFRPPVKLDNEIICPEETTDDRTWWEKLQWKTIILGLVICALLLPVCILFCIWPRREREIQEKYQERLLRYAATPKHKADNATYEPDDTIPSRKNSVSHISPNRSSIKKKTDFVQLTASQLNEQHFNVLPDQQSDPKNQQQQNKPVTNGPQRVHLLRSRPPSKPTVVSPATALYASVDAPSPDDSIEMLARDILATPNTYAENQKTLSGPMVSSLVRFRPSDSAASRVVVSSLAETINGDLHKAGTSLPEPQ